jgi:hypothetical protein
MNIQRTAATQTALSKKTLTAIDAALKTAQPLLEAVQKHYRNNVAPYPQWQKFLRDLPKAEMHRLAGGHFAVEDNLHYIASNIKRFYKEKVATTH